MSNFILLYMNMQFSQQYSLKRLFFPHLIFLAPLLKLYEWISFLILCSIPLVYMSVLKPTPSFDYCFCSKFSNWKMKVIQFNSFFRIVLTAQNLLRFLMKYSISLTISRGKKSRFWQTVLICRVLWVILFISLPIS